MSSRVRSFIKQEHERSGDNSVLCVLKTLAAGGNESEGTKMRKSSEDEYIKNIAQNKALEAIDTLCAAMYRETVAWSVPDAQM